MTSRRVVLALAIVAAAAAAAPSQAGVPTLAKAKRAPGEVVIVGQGRGVSYGPWTFRGGLYRFRFARWDAPYGLDSLVVQTTTDPGVFGDLVINTEAAAGSSVVRISGRMFVKVTFGSGRYVLRFQRVG